jgi:hypothetical protein
MCYGSFVLVIKISAIRILARRRRVNLGLVRLLFGGFRYSDLGFFTEIRSPITFKSLL